MGSYQNFIPPEKNLYISPQKKTKNKTPFPKYKIQLHQIFFPNKQARSVRVFKQTTLSLPTHLPKKTFMSPPKNCPFQKNFIWRAEKVFFFFIFFLLINNWNHST